MTIHVTGLYTYPIKSCGRLEHQRIALGERGFVNDRRWMVVSAAEGEYGEFLTQRELPQLAIVQPFLTDDALQIAAPERGTVSVPLEIPSDTPVVRVPIWKDTAEAHDEGDEVAQFLSNFLNYPVRLVRMTDAHYRRVDPQYSAQTAQVGFADGYPILLTNESSLDELNVRIQLRGKTPVPMNRFRPNIVIKGVTPFDEDTWAAFEINGILFEGVKLCARCAIPTIDQAQGVVPDVQEPSATLATFRKRDRGVMFGQNVVHRGLGEVAVGDVVELVERYETSAP